MARSNSPIPILEATLRVIVQGGVNAVRYRDVAAEAGIALGTISYQFPSREELIRAAFQHFLTENTNTMRAVASARAIETPRDVAALCVELLRADFANPDKPYVAEYELMAYAARDEAVASALAASDRTLVLEVGAVLEQVGIRSPFAAAQTLIDVIRGYQLTALGKREPDLDGLQTRLTRLLTALGPVPKELTRPPAPVRRKLTRPPAPVRRKPARPRALRSS